MYPQQDHDSLTRAEEQIKGLVRDRDQMLTRIKTTEDSIDAMRLSKADLAALTGAIGAVSGLLVKLFW
jgi:hypothetical protein